MRAHTLASKHIPHRFVSMPAVAGTLGVPCGPFLPLFGKMLLRNSIPLRHHKDGPPFFLEMTDLLQIIFGECEDGECCEKD